jgi:protein-disulfide isomerase
MGKNKNVKDTGKYSQMQRERRILDLQKKKEKQNKRAIIAIGAVLLIAIIVIVIWLLAGNSNHNSTEADSPMKAATKYVLNDGMIEGDTSSPNHFVEYTDVFCPYCGMFNRAITDNHDDFKKNYLDSKKMYYEIRVTNALADPNKENDISTTGGESTYCATKQGKFWPYYEALQKKINEDYYSKGIGAYHGAPDIPDIPLSYYEQIANSAGLDGGKLRSCIDGKETLFDLQKSTESMQKLSKSGLPLFILNDYSAAGFSGDYAEAKKIFAAGGVE